MDEDLKQLIRRYIREALEEFFSHPKDEEPRENESRHRVNFPGELRYRLFVNSVRLEDTTERLSLLVQKLESWSASSCCNFSSSDVKDIKNLLQSIDSKV